jgi:hypothetical protein
MNGRRRGISTSACDSTRELEKTRPQISNPRAEPTASAACLTTGLTRLMWKDQFTEVFALSRWTLHQLPSHSVTTTVPVMSSCPSPQNTSHENVNLPVLLGVNRIRADCPGLTSARIPNPRRLNPCLRSCEDTTNTTGSPFFKVIVSGVNANFFAVM